MIDVTPYLPRVRHIAAHIFKRLPQQHEFEELVQDGMLGLLDAAQRYDPSRGVAFQTFAGKRIQGAILDALRQQDPLSKGERRKHTDAFVADVQMTPVEADRHPAGDTRAYDVGWIRARLAQLEPRDRFVLTAIYYHEREHADIARVLGVHESRVSQIHQRALRRLRRES